MRTTLRTGSMGWMIAVALSASGGLAVAFKLAVPPCAALVSQGGEPFPVAQLDQPSQCRLNAVSKGEPTARVIGPLQTSVSQMSVAVAS